MVDSAVKVKKPNELPQAFNQGISNQHGIRVDIKQENSSDSEKIEVS